MDPSYSLCLPGNAYDGLEGAQHSSRPASKDFARGSPGTGIVDYSSMSARAVFSTTPRHNVLDKEDDAPSLVPKKPRQRKRFFKCTSAGCNNKAFFGSSHLKRHIARVHGLNPDKVYRCDYPKCPHYLDRVPLDRLDQLRDHYRDHHDEDLPERSQRVNLNLAKTKRIIPGFWRCDNCLSRVSSAGNVWECMECRQPCQSARKAARIALMASSNAREKSAEMPAPGSSMGDKHGSNLYSAQEVTAETHQNSRSAHETSSHLISKKEEPESTSLITKNLDNELVLEAMLHNKSEGPNQRGQDPEVETASLDAHFPDHPRLNSMNLTVHTMTASTNTITQASRSDSMPEVDNARGSDVVHIPKGMSPEPWSSSSGSESEDSRLLGVVSDLASLVLMEGFNVRLAELKSPGDAWSTMRSCLQDMSAIVRQCPAHGASSSGGWRIRSSTDEDDGASKKRKGDESSSGDQRYQREKDGPGRGPTGSPSFPLTSSGSSNGGSLLSCPYRKRNSHRFNIRDHEQCARNGYRDMSCLK